MHCIEHQEMFAMENNYDNVKRGIRLMREYITGITSNAQLYEPWSVIFPLTSRALMNDDSRYPNFVKLLKEKCANQGTRLQVIFLPAK